MFFEVRREKLKFSKIHFDRSGPGWVPVLISILFGKTASDYHFHFEYLLSCYEFVSWKDFQERFPGNTCDFSDALRIGFFDAVKNLARDNFSEEVDDEQIRSFYCFCNVHFQRSRARITSNHRIVDPFFVTLSVCVFGSLSSKIIGEQ